MAALSVVQGANSEGVDDLEPEESRVKASSVCP